MRIAEFRTFVVGNPPPHFGGRYFVFLKLVTDGGIAGVGEVYGVPFHPQVVARMIEDVCERHVVGADPFRIERLWRIVYSSGYTQRPDTSLTGILSGIERRLPPAFKQFSAADLAAEMRAPETRYMRQSSARAVSDADIDRFAATVIALA